MTSSGIDDARMTVLLDVRHPLAYLALHPTAALADELGIEVNWLPLVVPPLNAPSAPGPDDDRGIRHRRYRAQAIAREIETYGAAQGLVLKDPYRDGDPGAVNLAWLWTRERNPVGLASLLAESFRAYWARELDPSDGAALAAIVERSGGDGSKFRSWCASDGPGAATALADELRERGLHGVPGYVLGDEFFLGRQHLPMIRWILEGRNGPGPI